MSQQTPLIIDCHGHYTTAPLAMETWRNAQIAAIKDPGKSPKASDLKISDDELRESIELNQLKMMKQRGSDITLFSPRASFMAHHIGGFQVSSAWAAICNELCYRVSQLFPDNFVPVAAARVGVQIDADIAVLLHTLHDLWHASGRVHPGALRQHRHRHEVVRKKPAHAVTQLIADRRPGA